MNYNKLAEEIEQSSQNMNIEEADYVEIEKDENMPSGYAVTINWKAGTSGDGVENPMDLNQLFFEDLDNDVINEILDRYRN